MADKLNLDAYFDRIGWSAGSGGATYQTLAGVLDAHMSSIPFENLDVLLGKPIRLDLDGLQKKLVRDHRGGYCFEHGMLFAAVLEELGFKPVRHTARVVVIMPRTAAPRAHMFLTVPLAEGTFVVDPGFGALAPRVPVPLREGVDAKNGAETHWMVRDGTHWMLRTRTAEKDVDCWVSTVEQDNLVDFEVGNHYVATHPDSPFVNRMMMRALTEDGRVAVMNRDVTIRRGSMAEPMQLADRGALRTLLVNYFGFDLPEAERIAVPSIPEWR
ncbi:MAG TPA: arylamine N-acetyltransferase [Casimicrobiaceae bacterium]|nr:arylamine N-acetyltransferase [Casimicrobiaceae bacterium]